MFSERTKFVLSLVLLAATIIVPVVLAVVSIYARLDRLHRAYPEYDFRWRAFIGTEVRVNGTWLRLDEWRHP